MEHRRSGIPGPSSGISGPGSHLPKRAPSPSSAAFSSAARASQNGGPLGSYASSSRDGQVRNSAHASTTSAAGPSRFGFSSSVAAGALTSNAPSSSSAIGRGIPSSASRIPPSSSAKRTISNAGLQDNEPSDVSSVSSTPASKRPFLTSASAVKHDHMESEYKRRELLSQKAYERLQQEYCAKGREVEKEKEQRLVLLRQWESLNAETSEERKRTADERKALRERVNALQQQNNELSLRIDGAESGKIKAEHELQSLKTELGIKNANLESQLAIAVAEVQTNVQAKERIAAELEAQQAEWDEERQRVQTSKGDEVESIKLRMELSDLLAKLRKLEAENLTFRHEAKALQSRKESIEMLKEQKRDLEKKVGVVEELRRKLAEAEAKASELEGEKHQWTLAMQAEQESQTYEEAFALYSDTYKDIPKSVPTPAKLDVASVTSYLSNLHGAIAGLQTRSQSLESRLSTVRKDCVTAEEATQKEKERADRLDYELEQSKTSILKSEKMRETTSAEVESYRRLLESYQQEAQHMSAQFDSASAQQIQVLEKQLQSRASELEAVSSELDDTRQKLSKLTAPGGLSADERRKLEQEHEMTQKDLLRQIGERQAAFDDLEKQCISLGKANDDLFARLGRGEFDQNKLRVLELTNNPVSQDRVIRTSTLEALRKENADLLAQVKEMNSRLGAVAAAPSDEANQAGNATEALIPAQTLANLQDEYEKLQQSMRDRDKAFDRLKEAFGAKAVEYVAAVKALFGYDMHVLSRGKVKLRSVYARTSKGTSLTFDAGEEGDVANMRLVGEARQGAANVANLKRYWLGADRCSVPCFLSALQLELYESTTQAVRSGWTEDDDEAQ